MQSSRPFLSPAPTGLKIDLPVCHTTAQGFYRVSVVENGQVVKEYPRAANLILDSGLDLVNTNTWKALLNYCVAGTGTTPTKDLLDGTWSQSGTTVTSSGSTYTLTSGDIGKYVGFTTGESGKITAVASGTSCTVNKTQTVASTTAALYRANQTGLVTEVVRTNTYPQFTNTDGNNSQSLILDQPNQKATIRRTYDFAAEVSAKNYTEVGVSPVVTVAANLFSRILLAGTVSVGIGQQLRVEYDLVLQFSNITSNPTSTLAITGWPVAYNVQSITASGTAFTVTFTAAHHFLASGQLNLAGTTPPLFTLSAATSNSTTMTLTTTSAHGRTTGDSVVVVGMTPSGYNGTWTCAAGTTGSTIVITSAANPGTGTVFGTVRLATPGTWYDGTWTIASVTSTTCVITSTLNPGPAGLNGTGFNNTVAQYYPVAWGIDQPQSSGAGFVTYFPSLYNSAQCLGMFDGPSVLHMTGFTNGVQTAPTFAATYTMANTTVRDSVTSTYTNGNFYRDDVNVFNAGTLNLSNIRSFGIVGLTLTSSNLSALVTIAGVAGMIVNLQQPQIKTSTNKLTLTIRKSWGRVLS